MGAFGTVHEAHVLMSALNLHHTKFNPKPNEEDVLVKVAVKMRKNAGGVQMLFGFYVNFD